VSPENATEDPKKSLAFPSSARSFVSTVHSPSDRSKTRAAPAFSPFSIPLGEPTSAVPPASATAQPNRSSTPTLSGASFAAWSQPPSDRSKT
jgi:hypothetical protein